MWDIEDTFTKFLYPFQLRMQEHTGLSDASLALTAVRSRVDAVADLCPLWLECQFQDEELDNMLPYVKQYVKLPENHRRYMINPILLKQLDNLQTNRMNADEAGFQISAIDLHLFFNGVGFLVFEVQPSCISCGPVTMAWIEDLNADLASLSQGKPMWQRNYGQLATCADGSTDMPGLFLGEPTTTKELIASLLQPLCQEQTFSCWQPLVDTFLPVYGAILLRPEADTPHRQANVQFKEFVIEHGIVLRKTLPSNNRNRFSQQLLDDPLHNYLPYHNVVHTQSLEGGFALAYDNGVSHFQGHNSGAMRSFRTNYFYMMLLALHQRMSILCYEMAAADATRNSDPASLLRTLREQIYDFAARCYFSQASFSEERDQLYRRWQRAFNINQMYDELKDQVHDIEGYLAQVARDRELDARESELRQEAERNRLIALITLVLLPISIAAGLIQASPVVSNWIHRGSVAGTAELIVASAAIAISVIIAAIALKMRRSRKA
ncbi:MAG: hypothetical protein ACYCYO_08680 [Bacilli bacterium]